MRARCPKIIFFFFNDTATTEIYTLSLHDALPIYTDDPLELSHDVAGGRIVKVSPTNGHLALPIPGPPNSLRRDRAPTSVELAVDIDPREPAARFRTGDDQFILNEHEWSPWIRASFPFI